MNELPSIKNTCAVIVTYHPDDKFPERVNQVIKQIDQVIIVDNGSSEGCLQILRKLSENSKIHLILNNENLGVATALNIGFNAAKNISNNFVWCLTLDQDTFVYSNLIDNLVSSYKNCEFNNLVGIIGSNYEEWTTGKILFSNTNGKQKWGEVENLPTSGCLTSIKMFDIVGDFRDNFFIDYVDTEYCLRVRKNGFKIIISPSVSMRHPLGYYRKSRLYQLLFSRTMVTNYPSFRHYYWTRNGLVLAREYLLDYPKWSIKEIYYLLIRRVVTVILFEANKCGKLGYILKGVIHSFIGRMNKM